MSRMACKGVSAIIEMHWAEARPVVLLPVGLGTAQLSQTEENSEDLTVFIKSLRTGKVIGVL